MNGMAASRSTERGGIHDHILRPNREKARCVKAAVPQEISISTGGEMPEGSIRGAHGGVRRNQSKDATAALDLGCGRIQNAATKFRSPTCDSSGEKREASPRQRERAVVRQLAPGEQSSEPIRRRDRPAAEIGIQ